MVHGHGDNESDGGQKFGGHAALFGHCREEGDAGPVLSGRLLFKELEIQIFR